MAGRRGAALLAAIGIPFSFAAGAWIQNERVRDYYIRQRTLAGYGDIERASITAYLQCLKEPPGCESQRQTYDFVRKNIDEWRHAPRRT